MLTPFLYLLYVYLYLSQKINIQIIVINYKTTTKQGLILIISFIVN